MVISLKMQIRIQMDDYKEYIWQIGPDTEYMVDGPFFIVSEKGKPVGMYAVAHVRKVVIQV